MIFGKTRVKMNKLIYSAEEVNQILFDITLEKAKAEEKLQKIGQIIKQVESLHPEVAIGDREGIRKIKEVLENE